MRNIKWTRLVAFVLILVVVACNGGGETEPTDPPPPPPTDPPPPPPPTDPPPAGLDFTLAPNFGQAELESGFVPDPRTVDLVSGGSIDVGSLGMGMGCTGYATAAPDYRLFWSGDATNVRFFFVPDDDGDDTTLIVNDGQGNWHCNDDYSAWNPLVEVSNPAQGQFDIWVGSYSSDEQIAGTLYITELDLDPGNFVGEQISQWASAATASSEYSNPDWAAFQATGAPDTTECGDIETAWASASSSGVEWLDLSYDTPVIPMQINIYETNSPGFINEVEVLDEDGFYHTIWAGTPGAIEDCPRLFMITVTNVDFYVVGVRVNLDQQDGGSWNEIDAVELIGRQ